MINKPREMFIMEKGSMNLINEFRFFSDNIDALIQKYNNKYVIIKDTEIKGVFDTFDKAYQSGTKRYELGTFLIQQCNEESIKAGHVFHSRVYLKS